MMNMNVHFDALPEGMTLAQVEGDIAEAIDEKGYVVAGFCDENGGRIDLELLDEDDNENPKFAQLTVKGYLQKVNFPKSTIVEVAGMEIPLYN